MSQAPSGGGERKVDRLHSAQWSRAAKDLGVAEDQLRERARTLVAGFPDAFRDALAEVATREARTLWKRSATRIAEYAASCLQRLAA